MEYLVAQAQTGAAQTETVGGARSGSFAGTPLTPQAKEPGRIEVPNATAPGQAAQPYQGQPVPTYHLQDAWPRKVESAPKPVVRQPPAAPRTTTPRWPSKIGNHGFGN